MSGKLSENIAYFARALREAGLPVGPGAVLDAVEAVEAAHIGSKEDFFWTLHAIFVKKREHSDVFTQAFRIFFRRRSLIEKIIATLSPYSPSKDDKPKKPEAGALRAAEALLQAKRNEAPPEKEEKIELDARFTVSEREILQTKDFAQMTADEITRAHLLIDRLELPDDRRPTRRFVAARTGSRIDPRKTFRNTLRSGGGMIKLEYRDRAQKSPPIVAICDISGSMADYTRLFLHFLHTLTDKRKRVNTFLFGTRLTNVTRSLKSRDPDEALENAPSRSPIGRAAHGSAPACIASTANGPAAFWGRARLFCCSRTDWSATVPKSSKRKSTACTARAASSSGSIRCCALTDSRRKPQASGRSCRMSTSSAQSII